MTIFPPIFFPVIYNTAESRTLSEAGVPEEQFKEKFQELNVAFYEIDSIGPALNNETLEEIKGECIIMSNGNVNYIRLSPKEALAKINNHIVAYPKK
jgi:hypothetical protein